MPVPVVLDCDPGHDDLVAILLAARHTALLAVTTVAGNAPLDRTTPNALGALRLFAPGVPVHAGADRPLVAAPEHAAGIHGESGLDGVTLPDGPERPEPTSAAERLLRESRETDGLWIIATGPLTNVALALRADPALAGRIAGISIMGGGLRFGNRTPSAEFNFWADPEAAAVVFASGAPILLCPLDVTHQVLVDAAFAARVRAIGTPAAVAVADACEVFAQRHEDVFFDAVVGPLHDPCAVLAVTHAQLFEFEDHAIEIVVGEGPARGASLADHRGVKGMAPPNARVAVRADGAAVLDAVVEAVAALDRA